MAQPEPRPMERKRKAPPVEPEVIDAPRAPRRPMSLPVFRFPSGAGQWLMVAVSLMMFKLSTDATHAALGGWIDYNTAIALQAALSTIERFHFAGNGNPFTWLVLAADTALTATGLGLVLLPNLFATPVYAFVTGTLLGGFGANGFSGFSLGVLSLVVGFIVAYGGDKTLDLAVGR